MGSTRMGDQLISEGTMVWREEATDWISVNGLGCHHSANNLSGETERKRDRQRKGLNQISQPIRKRKQPDTRQSSLL